LRTLTTQCQAALSKIKSLFFYDDEWLTADDGRQTTGGGDYPVLLFCLYALVLPLSLHAARIVMVMIGVYALICLFRFRQKILITSRLSLLFIAFFLIHFLALLYTDDLSAGVWELAEKACLFIFPFAIFTAPMPSRETHRRVLFAFVVGCLISALICFISSLINYHRIGAVSWLSYSWLSEVMGFKPVYLSLYLCFTFFTVIHWLIIDWKKYSFLIKISGIIALLFCSYMIIMLGARLVSVTFLLLLFASFLIWMKQKKQLLLGLVVMSLLMLTLWSLMSSFFVTRTRMNKIIGKQRINYEHNFFINVNDPRGQIWESCFEAISPMPMWGYGIGTDIDNILMSIYKTKAYQVAIDIEADAHNQYLETLLKTGFLGCLILLATLLIPLYLSWRRKAYLYTLFLLLLMLPMLTETILEAPHGLMFYAFFNSLLIRTSIETV